MSPTFVQVVIDRPTRQSTPVPSSEAAAVCPLGECGVVKDIESGQVSPTGMGLAVVSVLDVVVSRCRTRRWGSGLAGWEAGG